MPDHWACAAILAEFTRIGLARGQLGSWAADYPRYAYTATILAIAGASPWLARVRLPSGRRAGLATRVADILLLEAVLIVNVHSLILGAGLFQDRADLTRALVTVALRDEAAPGVVRDRSLVLVPSPSSLQAIVASAGSPTRGSPVPGVIPAIRPATMDDALNRLVGGAVPRAEATAAARQTGPAPPGRGHWPATAARQPRIPMGVPSPSSARLGQPCCCGPTRRGRSPRRSPG